MTDTERRPKALALVGMPGAGKTICAEHLARRGFFTLRFGAVVVDEVRRRGLEVNPSNERIVREELRDTTRHAGHGDNLAAEAAMRRSPGSVTSS